MNIISKNNHIRYIIEKNKNKNICLMLRINVGSRDEPEEINGISHLLEHIFFRGSTKSYILYITNRKYAKMQYNRIFVTVKPEHLQMIYMKC